MFFSSSLNKKQKDIWIAKWKRMICWIIGFRCDLIGMKNRETILKNLKKCEQIQMDFCFRFVFLLVFSLSNAAFAMYHSSSLSNESFSYGLTNLFLLFKIVVYCNVMMVWILDLLVEFSWQSSGIFILNYLSFLSARSHSFRLHLFPYYSLIYRKLK